MTDWIRSMDDNQTGERATRPTRSGSRLPATRRDQPVPVVSTSRSNRLSDERVKAEPSDRRAVITAPPSGLADVPASVLEAVRFLVASLQNQEKEAQLPTRLGFTSALTGEGVTFLSRTVAAVVAHDLRERVCLIDLNWTNDAGGKEEGGSRRRRRRRRRQREVTTPDIAPLGLADVLRRDATLREIIVQSDDLQLSTVAAGAATSAEAQVFAQSNELAHVVNVLERHYDRLVFDLPPVLASSASITLARQADAIALVVRQGVTSDTQVRQALERLAPVPSLGVVLNRVTSRIPRSVQRRLAAW
jgi:Mrp family chromosome partitioning ATPase